MPHGLRHRAGDPAAGARAALRQAGGAARAPQDGEALASRHRAARAPARAPAPPAGDQRGGRPARAARRDLARRQGLRATRSRSPPRPRASAAPRRARAPTPSSSASASTPRSRPRHDPFGSRVPDHSVVHRYARCNAYPEWGVGTRHRHLLLRRGRRHAAVGAREVPARDPHGPRRHAALRRLLEARPGAPSASSAS